MRTKMRLGELLIASGLLTGEQLESALQGQRASGMKLGEYLIKQGICRESDVVDAVCRLYGLRVGYSYINRCHCFSVHFRI